MNKKKFVMESLKDYLNENIQEGISPEDLERELIEILNSNKGAVEIYADVRALIDQYPEVHNELGEVEGKDKYAKAMQPLYDWWFNLSDEEAQAIENQIRGKSETEKNGREEKQKDEFDGWMSQMVEKGVFTKPLSYDEYREAFAGAPRSAYSF